MFLLRSTRFTTSQNVLIHTYSRSPAPKICQSVSHLRLASPPTPIALLFSQATRSRSENQLGCASLWSCSVVSVGVGWSSQVQISLILRRLTASTPTFNSGSECKPRKKRKKKRRKKEEKKKERERERERENNWLIDTQL